MMQDMVRLFMFLFALGLVLTIVALISCLSADDDEVRALPRPVWVIVILVLPVVGATIYLAAGRPAPGGAGTAPDGARSAGPAGRIWRTAAGLSTRRSRTVAPDDDPEFLRSIDSTARAQDDEALRRWEEEFRRGPDDQRKQDKSIDDSPPGDG
jgi:hypothetical protein